MTHYRPHKARMQMACVLFVAQMRDEVIAQPGKGRCRQEHHGRIGRDRERTGRIFAQKAGGKGDQRHEKQQQEIGAP
jgi:hypothetical protein